MLRSAYLRRAWETSRAEHSGTSQTKEEKERAEQTKGEEDEDDDPPPLYIPEQNQISSLTRPPDHRVASPRRAVPHLRQQTDATVYDLPCPDLVLPINSSMCLPLIGVTASHPLPIRPAKNSGPPYTWGPRTRRDTDTTSVPPPSPAASDCHANATSFLFVPNTN